MDEKRLIEVDDLRIHFPLEDRTVKAVDGVSWHIDKGETLAVVGESGSGKTMIGLSILHLVPGPNGRIAAGRIALRTKDRRMVSLDTLDEQALQELRGDEVAMVFQEPMTSLNPVYPVGEQIAEALRRHRRLSKREALAEAARLLAQVGIPDPELRLRDYPHQLSGGMRQRVMIAIALSCNPSLVVADEPTTALDVTVQAQILDLLRRLQERSEQHFALLFITHNLGVVAEIADRVLVVYCGRIVEEGPVAEVFGSPRHPYTRGLLSSLPRRNRLTGERLGLAAIPGNVPGLADRPGGCAFAPRCADVIERCRSEDPPLEEAGSGRRARCLRWRELGA